MKKNSVKYITLFIVALIVRLLPFRAPNLEPIIAIQMPFAKVYGGLYAFMFGFMSIAIYDALTSGIGIWTWITAFAYGLIGLGARIYLKNGSNWKNYAIYALIGTISFDALTGLTLGPLFFGQTFTVALLGQIPFTVIHLLGNVSFAIVLSPVIARWIEKSESVSVGVSEVVRV
jgi:uncharacterized membrane protein